MSVKIYIALLAVMLVNLIGGPTRASITIIVEPNKANYSPGETAVMTVFAYDSSQTEDTYLEGFRLGFDLQPTVGKGYDLTLSGFSGDFGGTSGVYTAGSPGGFLTSVSSANFDFRATGERDPNENGSINNLKNTTSSNAIKLFTVNFDISTTATAGSYNFVFSPGSATSGGVYNRVTLGEGGISNQYFEGDEGYELFFASGGAFTISGEEVPEPSTIALLTLGLAGGGVCRRFRRRFLAGGVATTGSSESYSDA